MACFNLHQPSTIQKCYDVSGYISIVTEPPIVVITELSRLLQVVQEVGVVHDDLKKLCGKEVLFALMLCVSFIFWLHRTKCESKIFCVMKLIHNLHPSP